MYDALVANGKNNMLLGITGATGDGITVLDLTSSACRSGVAVLKNTRASLGNW